MLFLVLHLQGRRCALEASRVVEVLPLVRIEPLLGHHERIAGTFNYRGELLPVVDLSRIVLGRPSVPRLSTRIILLNFRKADGSQGRVGLVAELATEIIRLSPDDFKPAEGRGADASYAGPIAMSAEGPVQQLLIDALLPPELRRSDDRQRAEAS